ncbi:hypothetical protein ACWCXC_15690 [Streptomyces sp. NPDC001515]
MSNEGDNVYTVTYTMNGEPQRTEGFETEREAVRFIGDVELYVNMELIGYSGNINRAAYRR